MIIDNFILASWGKGTLILEALIPVLKDRFGEEFGLRQVPLTQRAWKIVCTSANIPARKKMLSMRKYASEWFDQELEGKPHEHD